MHVIVLALAVALGSAPKAPQKTQLKIDVKPASTVVFVDGKRKGTGAKEITVNTTPGRHVIKLVHGLDEHQEVITVKKGESKKWTWAFEDDRPKRGASAGTETEGADGDGDEGGGSGGAGSGPEEDDDGPPPDDT